MGRARHNHPTSRTRQGAGRKVSGGERGLGLRRRKKPAVSYAGLIRYDRKIVRRKDDKFARRAEGLRVRALALAPNARPPTPTVVCKESNPPTAASKESKESEPPTGARRKSDQPTEAARRGELSLVNRAVHAIQRIAKELDWENTAATAAAGKPEGRRGYHRRRPLSGLLREAMAASRVPERTAILFHLLKDRLGLFGRCILSDAPHAIDGYAVPSRCDVGTLGSFVLKKLDALEREELLQVPSVATVVQAQRSGASPREGPADRPPVDSQNATSSTTSRDEGWEEWMKEYNAAMVHIGEPPLAL